MNDLNEVLDLNLNKISIYEINEEKLIALKSCDYYLKNNFYFWLINKINSLENKSLHKELAYAHYLMSYYIFIVLTPLSYEELAFYHIQKALKYDDNIDYKEWTLIFATLPTPFLKAYDAIKMAEKVLEKDPSSTLANTILQIF
ncbi:hypothetical protein R0131_07020 [Clostridium sp. AL.422]|uniref:hypothetical protein n=1 Tax=Clostridium TaxID=1485 RepID=UPI00293DB6D6|nr:MULTISPECIES: hypothetical protein [unclassified Clostridium]MDV4150584.1 hypothetical protein [Clostridium sp. AL.422]